METKGFTTTRNNFYSYSVGRRQILTTKVGPRAVRVNVPFYTPDMNPGDIATFPDVQRRQILTTKVDPRTVRVKVNQPFKR